MKPNGPSLALAAALSLSLTGLAQPALGASADDLIRELGSPEPTVHGPALEVLRAERDPAVIDAVAEASPRFSVDVRAGVLLAIAPHRSAAVEARIRRALASRIPDVRTAAIRAVGQRDDVTQVSLLLEIAAHGSPAKARDAAAGALAQLGAKGTDAALIAACEGDDPALGAAALAALGNRRSAASIPLLVKLTRNPRVATQAAAFGALGKVIDPSDHPKVLDILIGRCDDSTAARDALWQVARRGAHNAAVSARILAHYETASLDSKKQFVLILGELGDPAAIDFLRTIISRPGSRVRLEAVRALAACPNPEVLSLLVRIAQNTADRTENIVAARGIIRLVETMEADPPEKVRWLSRARGATWHPMVKRQILAALSAIPAVGALQQAAADLDDPVVHPEAALAVAAIAREIGSAALKPIGVRPTLEKAAPLLQDADVRSELESLIGQL